MMKKLLRYIKNPQQILIRLLLKISFCVPDKIYIKLMYRLIIKKKLNLDNPQTFNEKLQWIKLNDRKDEYTMMVDKHLAKEYVENIIGKQHIIPTVAVYNNFAEIDLNKLPEKFVLKCTHDSGMVVICKNKMELNWKQVEKKVNKALKKNYYYIWREWPYKNVEPKIIIEQYMGDNLLDYKLQCFNGKVDNILVCEGRNTQRGVRYHYFDTDWNYLDYCLYEDVNAENICINRPENLDKMIEIAEKLSSSCTQMRVDLYDINNVIYFGEITFFSNAGFDTDITEKADLIMGKKLILPKR